MDVRSFRSISPGRLESAALRLGSRTSIEVDERSRTSIEIDERSRTSIEIDERSRTSIEIDNN